MPYVICNPLTKEPTGFLLPEGFSPITFGPYQNAVMVTDEEQKALFQKAVELHTAAFPYVMRERERCAKIAEAEACEQCW